jgi:hypothetical protein
MVRELCEGVEVHEGSEFGSGNRPDSSRQEDGKSRVERRKAEVEVTNQYVATAGGDTL